MMKRILIASAIAVSLGSATGALAHGDEDHGKKEEQHDDGHAATLGKPGDPGKVNRNVTVEMSDAMRFRPDSIRVKRGETIRFIVKNTGKVKHEMVLGTIKELKEHADPNQVSVDPGMTGELIWQFSKAGTFDFACLVPGHFEAGMVGKILVGGETGATSAESGQAMTSGVVKKVDKGAGKVTISHGPLENLGMPKMTMVFRVKDPAMLDRLKEGDKIFFVAEKVDGALTVMSFESAK